MKLMANTVMAMARPGGNHNQGIDSRIVNDCASLSMLPTMAGRPHAEAQERQCRLEQNCLRYRKGAVTVSGESTDGHVPNNDVTVGGTECPRR